MAFCCFMSAQTGTPQASTPSSDAPHASEVLKTIDQLIEQNQQLEKQNQQIEKQSQREQSSKRAHCLSLEHDCGMPGTRRMGY
jgi:cell shape-determining protein MreC